jgi:hypothetical protein
MTTTSKIDEHIREAVMTAVLTASPAGAVPTAALMVPRGPNKATAGASVGTRKDVLRRRWTGGDTPGAGMKRGSNGV